jgi:hypothetical protein
VIECSWRCPHGTFVADGLWSGSETVIANEGESVGQADV